MWKYLDIQQLQGRDLSNWLSLCPPKGQTQNQEKAQYIHDAI
jgi:hypothetical protein